MGAFEPLFSFLSSGDKMSGKPTKAKPDMLSAVDVDKVIREDIPDGQEGHWYLSMSKTQRDEAAESLSRISQAICGRTKQDIIEHIDDGCVSKDYLKQREDEVYMPSLKEAMKKAVSDVSKDVASTLVEHMGDVTEILTRMSEKVAQVEKSQQEVEKSHNEERRRRKEDREQIEKNTRDIEALKSGLEGMAYESMQIKTAVASLEVALKNVDGDVTEIKSDVRMLVSKLIPEASSSKGQVHPPIKKQSFWASVPTPLWVVIGGLLVSVAAGTATALVYIKTGQIIPFGG